MPPISPSFNIGPLSIHFYGIIIVTGALVGGYVATIEAGRRGEEPEHVWNALTWCLIGGILGARLYHVLSSPQGDVVGFQFYFVTNPFETIRIFGASIPFPTALMIWNGGLGIFGGVAGGVLALAIYAWRNNLSILRWLDIAAPGLILAQAVGRWGNYINQELYGPPTTLPWGIRIDAEYRLPQFADLSRYPVETTRFHPVFLYESLWNLATFIALIVIGRRFKDRLVDGDIASLYLILYGLGRLFIEALRPDAWLVGGIPTAQIVSAVMIVVGAALMVWRRQQSQSAAALGDVAEGE
ncbi:MAG: prolipoprotein diacylglyceryl transferase [Ardenticatenia bacterium]|nr:prolipoprotein diacylglyceryl transferase [Ardenticatenia bacterium]